MYTTYRHEPFADFTEEQNRQAFAAAIQDVEKNLGQEYPLVIGGFKMSGTDAKAVGLDYLIQHLHPKTISHAL